MTAHNEDSMSSALVRVGLWLVLVFLILALLRETLLAETSDLAIASGPLIEKGLIGGVAVTALGGVMLILQRLFGAPPKGRCAECGRRVPKGDIYCRLHLRKIIYEEADRGRNA